MKKILMLFAMVITMTSFAQDRESQYKEALSAHNKKIVGYFFDALEKRDFAQLRGVFDSKGRAVYSTISAELPQSVEGRESIGSQFETIMNTCAKAKYFTDLNVSKDPSLVMANISRVFIAADGTKTKSNYMASFRLKDGKITEYIEYNNSSQNRS